MRNLLILVAGLSLAACKSSNPTPPANGSSGISTASLHVACDDNARKAPKCGGLAAIKCAAGMICVDDPCDTCDPDHGGADCGGICVAH